MKNRANFSLLVTAFRICRNIQNFEFIEYEGFTFIKCANSAIERTFIGRISKIILSIWNEQKENRVNIILRKYAFKVEKLIFLDCPEVKTGRTEHVLGTSGWESNAYHKLTRRLGVCREDPDVGPEKMELANYLCDSTIVGRSNRV